MPRLTTLKCAQCTLAVGLKKKEPPHNNYSQGVGLGVPGFGGVFSVM